MDPEEVRFQDGFPLGDGGDILEAAVVGRDDGGGGVVGFHVQDFPEGKGDGFPVRREGDGSGGGGAEPVQPQFEEIAARVLSGFRLTPDGVYP